MKGKGKTGKGKGKFEPKGGKGKGQGNHGKATVGHVDENTCRICGKKGHWGNECWFNQHGKGLKGKGKGKEKGKKEVQEVNMETLKTGGTSSSSASVTHSGSASAYALDVKQSWVLTLDCRPEISMVMANNFDLVLDSGSAIHVCPPTFAPMVGVKASTPLSITTAGGHQIAHIGKKQVNLDLNGVNVQVRFEVAEVKRPLLSISMMVSHGWTVTFRQDKCMIRNPYGVTIVGRKKNGLYLVPGRFIQEGRDMVVMPVEVGAEEMEQEENKEEEIPMRSLEEENENQETSKASQEAKGLSKPVRKEGDPSELVHALTHTPYQPWCETCVAARG
jgi:hypothetical protein